MQVSAILVQNIQVSHLTRKHSPVFVPKSHCRHSTNCKAATRFCLGYALPPRFREYTYIEILKSKQDDRYRPSDRLWCWNLGPCQHSRTYFRGFSVQAVDRDRCFGLSRCHSHHVLGCRRASSDLSKVMLNRPNSRCGLASNHFCRDDGAKTGAVKMISKILKTTMHLPDRIQAICWVQFWAWIGE